jgi:phospholipid/cholesterol/gamma-HCH transport system substrate-binding protein
MSARTPILVGSVLIVAAAAFVYFIMGTSKDRFGGSDKTYVLYADFDDASGIRYKTRLQVNGIDVGKIDGISHVRGADQRLKARVKLRIASEYTIYENAVLRKVAESLLGDFRLDLDPGTPNFPPIPPGGLIKNVVSRSDLEQIQESLRRVSANVEEVTASLSHVLSGPAGEGSIKSILANVEKSMAAIETTTRVLSQIVAKNDATINGMITDLGQFSHAIASEMSQGGDLKQVAENLAKLSARLEHIATSVDTMVGTEHEAGTGRGDIRETVSSLNDTAKNLANISRKIDEGQGTLGRVINDPTLVNKVEDTLSDAQQLVGGLSRLQTEVELRTQYEVPLPGANTQLISGVKNILGVRIIPRPDKWYVLEAISDPRGTQTKRIITTGPPPTTNTPNPTQSSVQVVDTSYNTLKFSAQFAKRYGPLTLRFGILENTGGLGADLHALSDKIELRLDAFDFTRTDPESKRDVYPRFRATGMYGFADHLFVQAGIDDPFNIKFRTWFLGGVLRFTDDDLKSLLVVAPKP